MKLDDKLYVFNDNLGFVSLKDKSSVNAGLKVVNSARISYNKQKEVYDEKDKKLVKFLIENDHHSPFRHTWYTFHLKAPLFVFRQLMKYQVASYWKTYEVGGQEIRLDEIENFYDVEKGCSWNEVSGRYIEFKPEFYVPEKPRGNTTGNKQSSVDISFNDDEWKQVIETSQREAFSRYQNLVGMGLAKELARTVLPVSLYSESYWTISLASVLHFLEQRLKPEAQFEIRKYAEGIKTLLKEDLDQVGFE